jgi:para-nitrobenzyl esterase
MPFSADTLGSLFSDYTPVVGLNHCTYLRTASTFTKLGMNLYQWEFADPNALVLGVGIPKGSDPKMPQLGPVHSAALNYLFPNLSNTSAIDAPDLPAASQALSNKMVQTWANFVKTGSPHTNDINNWSRFSGNGNKVMMFKPDAIAEFDAYTNHHCEFWNALDPSLNPIN